MKKYGLSQIILFSLDIQEETRYNRQSESLLHTYEPPFQKFWVSLWRLMEARVPPSNIVYKHASLFFLSDIHRPYTDAIPSFLLKQLIHQHTCNKITWTIVIYRLLGRIQWDGVGAWDGARTHLEKSHGALFP